MADATKPSDPVVRAGTYVRQPSGSPLPTEQ